MVTETLLRLLGVLERHLSIQPTFTPAETAPGTAPTSGLMVQELRQVTIIATATHTATSLLATSNSGTTQLTAGPTHTAQVPRLLTPTTFTLAETALGTADT